MLKFYDDTWRVTEHNPSEDCLWVEKEGLMWSIDTGGKIGLLGTAQECISIANVKECSPQYVLDFFQKHDLKIEEVDQ